MMKYKILDGAISIQGSPEWLAFRKGKITASMAPTIMGENPYETPLQLYESIIEDKPKPKNEAMERGNRLEPKAREWVNNVLGVNYQPAVVQSVSHSDFIASLDGLYFDESGKPHILEIKCPGAKTHQEALEGRVPIQYKSQLQHQMDLVGVDSMIYCSFDGETGAILSVKRDEKYCGNLFAEEMHFLWRLINFQAPEATDRDWIEINDPGPMQMVSKLREINDQIYCLEMEKEKIRSELIFDHPRIKIGNMKVQRVLRRGNIQYDKIPELQNLDLEPYRKPPTTSVRIYD